MTVVFNGALAQLGERLICIQEVNGSIPLGSTKTSQDHQDRPSDGFDHPVRDDLQRALGCIACKIGQVTRKDDGQSKN